MRPPDASPGEPSDSFRLHFVQGTRRCVVSYDTLRAALAGAFKRLEKDSHAELWISDDGRHILLDGAQLRERFAEHQKGGAHGPG